MKNKNLEGALRKSHGSIIKLIEKCEEGSLVEIKITDEEGLTSDERLDKRVFNYLKRLNVKITIITEQEFLKSKNKFYKPEAKCESPIHEIVNGSAPKAVKQELLHGQGLFRIDDTSYITCKECFKILPILGE